MRLLFSCFTIFLSSAIANADVSKIEQPDWYFSDDFENDKNTDFWLGDGVYLEYGANDPTNPGNHVMAMRYVPNSEGGGDSWSEHDFRLGINAVQIEMGWKMYIPGNYKHIENNHKVFALWSGTYGKANANISISSEAWGQHGGASPSIYVGVDGNNFGHSMLSNLPYIWKDQTSDGEWISITIVIELASQEGDYGKMELFLNDSILTSTSLKNLTKPYKNAPTGTELISFSHKGNYLDQGTILGWANGDIGFTEETVFLIDDFYIKANSKFGSISWAEYPESIKKPNKPNLLDIK